MTHLLKLAFGLASTRLGGWFFTTLWPPVDRVLLRASRGRFSIAGLGVPVLLLSTTGRRTGKTRRVPLLYLPYIEGARAGTPQQPVVVMGSRGGRRAHAGWFHNLQADPHVQVSMAGVTGPYRAEVLRHEERDAQWARLLALNPRFRCYEARVERQIPIVLLRPQRPADT